MYVCIVLVHSAIVAFPFVQTALLYIHTCSCDANLLACTIVYIVDNVPPETMLTVSLYYSAVKPWIECESKVDSYTFGSSMDSNIITQW